MAGHLEQDGAVHDNNFYEVRPPPGRLGPTTVNQGSNTVAERAANYAQARVKEEGEAGPRVGSDPESYQSEESGAASDKQLRKKLPGLESGLLLA